MPDTRPGPWLQLTALAAAAACLLAVLSGALQLGTAHRALAALALPPLCAAVAASWLAHRRLLPASTAALVSFLAAALLTSRPVHLAAAGLDPRVVTGIRRTARDEKARHQDDSNTFHRRARFCD